MLFRRKMEASAGRLCDLERVVRLAIVDETMSTKE